MVNKNELLKELCSFYGEVEQNRKQDKLKMIKVLDRRYIIASMPQKEKLRLINEEKKIIKSGDGQKSIIKIFQIEENRKENEIEFDSYIKIASYIEKVKNITNIEKYIEEHPSEENYKSILKEFKNDMEDVYNYYKRRYHKREEIDELRDECIKRIKSTLEDNIIENLIDGIYRKLKNNYSFIEREMLKKVNEHLSECGIYTEDVQPGMTVDKDLRKVVRVLEPISYTEELDKHKQIKEVVRLPYYLKYCFYEKKARLDFHKKLVAKGKVYCYSSKKLS